MVATHGLSKLSKLQGSVVEIGAYIIALKQILNKLIRRYIVLDMQVGEVDMYDSRAALQGIVHELEANTLDSNPAEAL
jgi:hypothetical protein